ncbi:MAG TPA: ABC transporter substrate-binding protein [Ignisphaera sp.]|uniref:ABC transporter substrate-binding protein n=1 Tax=Ignisphaera aggregans TaxID=334771 RepID=A0A832YZU7_9CREN|nr:ABC transporter substrate-binding protein [Ignisphaera sp.]HIP57276.1 ABC transporter substrate-binding protein [Ignisphaera aggregans]
MAIQLERTIRARGGKTVTIYMKISNCRILDIAITGDFFSYPEDAIERLERALALCASIACIELAIDTISRSAHLLGVEWEELKQYLVDMFRLGCQ